MLSRISKTGLPQITKQEEVWMLNYQPVELSLSLSLSLPLPL